VVAPAAAAAVLLVAVQARVGQQVLMAPQQQLLLAGLRGFLLLQVSRFFTLGCPAGYSPT
jgi:hypothetical protein